MEKIRENEIELHGEAVGAELLRQREQEIRAYADKHLGNLPVSERERVIEETVDLYKAAGKFVAPIFTAFADHLLQQTQGKGEEAKIVFVARDGIGPYQAAQALLEKFPDRYPDLVENQLIYAYFTRKLVYNAPPDVLREYAQSLGIKRGDCIALADVGMYGSIVNPLRAGLSGCTISSVEYLISRTPRANGFIDDGSFKRLPVFDEIMGNKAVHFLEDTFSGEIKSPSALERTESGLEPDTRSDTYPPEIAVKRLFALAAIRDYVKTLDAPDIDLEEARARLNEFLTDRENFDRMMVPHER